MDDAITMGMKPNTQMWLKNNKLMQWSGFDFTHNSTETMDMGGNCIYNLLCTKIGLNVQFLN